MAFTGGDTQYTYKWTAAADKDNPYYTKGTDHSQLNREEGYEMLYFINHFVNKHLNGTPTLKIYQTIETAIKEEVPTSIRTHKKIADWLLKKYE